MPSWSVHLALAKRLKDKYHYSDNFVIGNIIPDVPLGYVIKNPLKPSIYDKTHYNTTKYQMPKSDIKEFLKENLHKLDNEIILGSYIHLLTDTYFNNYTSKFHLVKQGEYKYALLNNGMIDYERHPRDIKQHDFSIFANNLAYGKKVGEKVKIHEDTMELVKKLSYDIDPKDLNSAIDEINRIVDINKNDERKLEMFNEPELLALLNSCYVFLDMQIENLQEKGIIKGVISGKEHKR